jgi:hypothetical protein
MGARAKDKISEMRLQLIPIEQNFCSEDLKDLCDAYAAETRTRSGCIGIAKFSCIAAPIARYQKPIDLPLELGHTTLDCSTALHALYAASPAMSAVSAQDV